MPFFNLDPETVMPWDIVGCIMFPDDEEMALLGAVNGFIQFRAGIIRGLKKMCNNSNRELENAIDDVWKGFGKELNRHGGLDVLGRLLGRSEFHKEQRRAIIEGMIAGMILRTAIQIGAYTNNVTQKITFALVEEEINRLEAATGSINYHGERIAIKRSEKD